MSSTLHAAAQPETVHVLEAPLWLDGGQRLDGVRLAYEITGDLNADRSNAVLVCHALTGDQYVARPHPVTAKPGWWDRMVGPTKPIDTDRFAVICVNVLGGCMGSTGPASLNPETNAPYALEFPVITIADMVRAEAEVVDALGIERLAAIVGGSMGGMRALQWAAAFKTRADVYIAIAAAARHSAQNIALHEIGRQAIMADPDWRGGRYQDAGVRPTKGLAVARMTAHVTYLSEAALHRKFGRNLQARDAPSFGFDADFQVESYLRHQGARFVERFDANSYLYITRAMDYFDLAASEGEGSLARAFDGVNGRFCLISFDSDWLYPTEESRDIVRALAAAGQDVSFFEIESDKGHDAFLLDEPKLDAAVRGLLEAAAVRRGLPSAKVRS
ncbi:MAG: homoserine O-acetyltransferase [Maricaulaceae bacterium]